MTDNHALVAMRGITKAFPGVTALQGIDFTLRRGEVHALMGENGAGKSTLIKVLTGAERPDRGAIELEGRPVQVRSPQHSQELGISTVYQEINLCTNLSVAENIMLGHEPRRLGAIDWRRMNALAAQALQRLGIDVDVARPLGSYSVAIQQMAAIARALEILSAKVLILDEPTSSLDAHETAMLFAVIRRLRAEGIGIIFITHFLDQVYQIADTITVLRNGALVGTFPIGELPRIELVARMLGRNVSELHAMAQARAESEPGRERTCVAEARGLGLHGSLQPLDLTLNAGEVVGVAGLLGSGRTELARLLFGIDTPDAGTLQIRGQQVERFSPHESLKRGIALCPEDRKAEGVIGELSIRENIILALQARHGWLKFLNLQQQYEIAEQYIRLLGIRTPSPDQLVKNLSGGNQQKVVLARWIVTRPHVLILDEPTRGIDVGAKVEIQKLVLDLVKEGMAILFISSELDEVLRISQRILVLRERKKVAEYPGGVDDQVIMHTIAGEL